MSEESYELSLLEELVSIKSTTGNAEGYKEIAGVLTKKLEELGGKIKVVDGGIKAGDGIERPNILAYFDFGGERTLLVLTHYDVVEAGAGWTGDPFKPRIERVNGDVRIYGRGAADDKGCIVASISAVRRIIEEGIKVRWNIALGITADEEIGGSFGAGVLAENLDFKPDAVLVADSSSFGLVVGTSGIVHGIITIRGSQGHAGYVLGSDNALHKTFTFMETFKNIIQLRALKTSKLHNPPDFPIPRLWGRISFTWIETPSKTFNIVPGIVRLGFDLRTIPEENTEDAIAELKAVFEITKHETGIHDVHLEIVRAHDGFYTDPDNPFVKYAISKLREVTGRNLPIIGMLGGNDGSWFRKFGVPIISFGAWDEKSHIHGADESVSLKKIIELRDFIVSLASG